MKINGARLNEAMESSGISRAEIAELIGLTYTRVWQMTTDAESQVSKLAGQAIAARLGVSEAFLTGGE